MIRKDAVSLAAHIERILAEGRPDLHSDVVKANAKRIVFDIIGMITFAFVQKAGATVGSTYLKDNPESVTPIASTLESHRIHLHQGRFPSPAPGLPTTA